MSKKTPKISREQRAAQVEQLQAQFTQGLAALVDSREWTRWLEFCSQLHGYSLRNLMLIQSQCPHATQVAGFRAWQAMGRQVRKGEKSLKILGYSPVKVERTNAQGEEVEELLPRFPVLSVFDISQTDPIEGADPIPQNPAHRLQGEDPAGIGGRVLGWLGAQGWDVTRERIPGAVNGYTDFAGRRVVVDAELSPAQAAKTAIHEAAHVLLHAEAGARRSVHRGVLEVEAESTAYVVAGALGLDSSSYSLGYVAQWAEGDLAVVESTAKRVLGAAHTILEGLGLLHG